MERPPSQKGTAVLPVVLALKEHPDCRKLVPQHLWKYFDEHILVSGWYPERDYWVLIAALVKTIDPATVGGDVWRYFARFSAQRDIAGQASKAGPAGNAPVGVYRQFASVEDPAAFFLRATRLWQQYHDTGRMEIVGGRTWTNCVVMRLMGFVIPIEGFVQLQGYYLEEYGRLVGLELDATVVRSTARKDPYCEWEHRLARTPQTEAYVASLPPFDG
ncbi:MAG TPA: hypothetical protein VHC69_28955 [Polyangiaceae bacterium]|nr:hypothetical protein [Polyangiaceae bacterium]